jgi:hypothetical protein
MLAVFINMGTKPDMAGLTLVGLTGWSATPAAQQRRPANRRASFVVICHNYLIRFMFRLETVLNQPALSLNFASSVKPFDTEFKPFIAKFKPFAASVKPFIVPVKHPAQPVKPSKMAVLNLGTPVKPGASALAGCPR